MTGNEIMTGKTALQRAVPLYHRILKEQCITEADRNEKAIC